MLSSRPISACGTRQGFTLVEMLVAVGLVVLMMSLFAQVFQVAGGSVSTQRGIMENDQRARTVQQTITGDLDARTFRLVAPFAPGESSSTAEDLQANRFQERRGYFYISENRPEDDSDDVLQLTVQLPSPTNSSRPTTEAEQRYLGKSSLIRFSGAFPDNQPDRDDVLIGNGLASGTCAEISYFLRKGKTGRPGSLYRRVLLLRDSTVPQPTAAGQNLLAAATGASINGSAIDSTTRFYNLFDHSAVLNPTSGCAEFIGRSELDNTVATSLGLPRRRFGHQHLDTSGTGGRPREFAEAPGSTNTFIGRFTLEEMSVQNFRYPQNLANFNPDPGGTVNLQDPMNLANPVTFDATTDVVREFRQDQPNPAWRFGSRRGEDLLLSNVHGFDIKVWDETLTRFVDLGGESTGLFTLSNRLNPEYGPSTSAAENRVFDTWQPAATFGVIAPPATDAQKSPPFRSLRFRPVDATNSPANNVLISSATPTFFWQPNTAWAVGTVTFPTPPRDRLGHPHYFVIIPNLDGSPTGSTAAVEPAGWPSTAGATVTDGGVTWQCKSNFMPLKAIQITVRFLDPSTQQMRTLTIVQSLVD